LIGNLNSIGLSLMIILDCVGGEFLACFAVVLGSLGDLVAHAL
jgi:hypothetical protein